MSNFPVEMSLPERDRVQAILYKALRDGYSGLTVSAVVKLLLTVHRAQIRGDLVVGGVGCGIKAREVCAGHNPKI